MKLQQQVEKLIKPVEDSVRIYVLDAGRREADDYLWFPAWGGDKEVYEIDCIWGGNKEV